MRNLLKKTFVMLAVAAPLAPQCAQRQGAAAPATPAIPAAGEVSLFFTIQWADRKGAKAEPLTLSKLRGQVVVLAFYPADFSRGCTVEMSKFRDEYKTIFGDGVTVLPISADSLTTHNRWADSMAFPFALGADVDGTVAKLYGSFNEPRPKNFARTIFVIGKDGKVVYSKPSFNVAAQVAYDELTAAIAAAKK